MKFIAKRPEPTALLQWKAENAETPENLAYGRGGFPAEEVRQSLLAEQSHLCAYTLKRLRTAIDCFAAGGDTRNACHIEHLLPQSRKEPGEDIDYRNIVACYPPSHNEQACEFGAKYKDDFDPQTGRFIVRVRMDEERRRIEKLALHGRFVSPLEQQVERHFSYKSDGEIVGNTDSGKLTVAVLKLNHSQLVNDRAAAIRGALAPLGKKKLSAKAARALATRYSQPDASNRLEPYCLAIAAAAQAYADREDKRAAWKKKMRMP